MTIEAASAPLLPINLTLGVEHDDAPSTVRAIKPSRPQETEECCLVQIYPPDFVSGMLLLEGKRLVAGREPSVDLHLADGSVSRNHAEFVREASGYLIRDLGSTNGTLVNDHRINEQLLRSGDTIQMGSFIFKFLSAGSIETKYHETVYSAITRDALTGAMNKRYLLESLQRETARAIRQGQPLSVLMLDIDHFKSVNDNHGHLVGDEVLREFGRRILAICREDDLFARYGGEEFCLVMSSTAKPDAMEIAVRCRLAIADHPFATLAGDLRITSSFGLACLDPAASLTPDALIKVADENLYQAKRSGRNRVVG